MKPSPVEITLSPDLGEIEIQYQLGQDWHRLYIEAFDVYYWYNPNYSYDFWKETLQKSEIKDYFEANFQSLYEKSEILEP